MMVSTVPTKHRIINCTAFDAVENMVKFSLVHICFIDRRMKSMATFEPLYILTVGLSTIICYKYLLIQMEEKYQA